MIRVAARVTLERLQSHSSTQGVNGFDFGRRSRGSVSRKATMNSLTTRVAHQLSANQQVKRDAFALAA